MHYLGRPPSNRRGTAKAFQFLAQDYGACVYVIPLKSLLPSTLSLRQAAIAFKLRVVECHTGES